MHIQTHIPEKAGRVYDAPEKDSFWPLMAIPFELPSNHTLDLTDTPWGQLIASRRPAQIFFDQNAQTPQDNFNF